MVKRFSIITIIGILLFAITGSYDARGLESLSYAVAIGVDKGNENLLRLSLQFSAPGSGGSRRPAVNSLLQLLLLLLNVLLLNLELTLLTVI